MSSFAKFPNFAALPALEIGGGPHPMRMDYEQFDAIDWSERTGLTYTLGDARHLPYPDGHFGQIFASNLLEHFPEEETTAVLAEWARVLVRNGRLELVVPDAMGILRDYFTGANPSWPECAERLLGSRDYEGNTHYRAFTISSFAEVIDTVPDLDVWELESTHRGGGVTCIAVKLS